jgi:hypothetical protein
MKNRKVLLSGLLFVSITAGLLLVQPVEPVQCAGNPWDIIVHTGSTGRGILIIVVDLEPSSAPTVCVAVEIDKNMIPEEKCGRIAAALDDNPSLTATCYGTTVKVTAAGSNWIVGIQLYEIHYEGEPGPGESLTAIEDDPVEQLPDLRAYLYLKGDGSEGEANLRIGDGPLVTVPTNGLSDKDIVEGLVSMFNDTYRDTRYRAGYEGKMIYVDNVPCPEGAAGGTNDPYLDFSLGLVPMDLPVGKLAMSIEEVFSRANCGGDPPIYQDIMVFPTPERYHGSDLNNNGKTNDTVLRYQNVETGEVINTGLIVSGAHHAIDIYENIIVFVGEKSRICYYDINTGTVSEVGVTGLNPSIFGHIITFSSRGTIHYYNLDTGALVNTKVKGRSPAIYQDVIVFCAGRKSTIWTYDLSTRTAVDTGIVGKNPALYETVIAFETPEAAVAEDLNGDGDTSDSVIRYCDMTTGIVHNTEMAGIYPALYGDRIAFTTPERYVNQDLNGDSRIQGNVIHHCNLKTGHIVNTQQLGTEPDIYDDTITFYLLEHWAGKDLNRDGDLSDPIVGTSRITVTKMTIAGPETCLFFILAAIGGITAYFKRRN